MRSRPTAPRSSATAIATTPWFERQLRLCLLAVMLQLGWEKAFDDTGRELAWWDARVRDGLAELT